MSLCQSGMAQFVLLDVRCRPKPPGKDLRGADSAHIRRIRRFTYAVLQSLSVALESRNCILKGYPLQRVAPVQVLVAWG
jgi:hypothetical protein